MRKGAPDGSSMPPLSRLFPGPGVNYPGHGPTAGCENIPTVSLKCSVMVPKAHAGVWREEVK